MHVAVTTTMSIYCFIVNFTSLQLFLDNPLIWPETAAALSWPWPLQSLNQDQLIHLKLIQLLPYLKIPKKQNFPNNKITVNIYLLTRDNCSWLEQLERSSVNIGKNWFFFFIFLTNIFFTFFKMLFQHFISVSYPDLKKPYKVPAPHVEYSPIYRWYFESSGWPCKGKSYLPM